MLKPTILAGGLLLMSAWLQADESAPPEREPVRRDPFRMAGDSALSDGSGLVQAEAGLVPNGIRVKGVLRIKGRDPVAIISVPGSQGDYHVREGEVVRIEIGGTDTAAAAGRAGSVPALESIPPSMRDNPALRGSAVRVPAVVPNATRRRKPAVFYLFISKINRLSIEAYPKTRPDAKQIFR